MRPALILFGFALVAACDSSTGPKPPSAQSVARHIDSLITADSSLPSNIRQMRDQVLGDLIFSPALGAVPTTVQVTTGAGVQTWQGFMDVEYDSQIPDTLFVLTAYSDANMTNVIVAQFLYEPPGLIPTSQSVALMTSDTIFATTFSPTVVTSVKSTGGPCTAATGLTDASYYAQFVAQCKLATFSGSVTATLPATAGMDPAFEHISISPQSFNGVQIVQ